MRRTLTRWLLGVAACVACGLTAAMAAQASSHLKIREISGGAGGSNQSYIELQMYKPGQNHVSGQNVTFWNADGLPVQSIALSGPNPRKSQSQRTILIGDSAVAGRNFTMDLTPFLDLTASHNLVYGGAVCFEAVPVDCVSWGAFTGASNLPDHATPYGAPLPTDAALKRSIRPKCRTTLQAADDTNNNAVDFVGAARAPRSNARKPTEKACANTKIKKRPKNRSGDHSPTWKFKSTKAHSTFKCKLDRKRFKKCKSPKTYHGLGPGKHTFKVEAIDRDGNADKTPAKDTFTVLP
jgi:hypothetical protein